MKPGSSVLGISKMGAVPMVAATLPQQLTSLSVDQLESLVTWG